MVQEGRIFETGTIFKRILKPWDGFLARGKRGGFSS